jgi:tungstate transport system ATP-binding protein
MSTVADSLGLALKLVAGADAELLQVVGLSLRVSLTACALGALAGLTLGAWLAVARFRGQGALVWALNTLLALPSVVVGLSVYLLLSRAGPLGSLGILFTPTAMVVAQSVLVVPLIAALSRRLVLDALAEGGEQLQSLGAGPLQRAALMLVHDRLAVLTVLLTAFGRAISEVGAVMIVGGNIDGVTRVMTTAIALETSKGDLPLALALGLVLLGVVGLVNGVIALLHRQGTVVTPEPSAPPAPVPPQAPSQAPSQVATHAATPAHLTAARSARAAAPASVPPAAPGQDLLRLHGAGLRFGAVQALAPLQLALRRGESLALVGANGAGKTSLLRLLHGLLPCTEGRHEAVPLQPEGHPPVAAMLFQRPFLLRLSVQRNVWLGLALRGVPRAERAARCAQALQHVGLQALAGRDARSLSGGQQQRLALARAWALRPDILFLDEPTASLDPSAKREVEALLADVAAAGVTLVMSTHNLGQVKRLANRVLYLDHGRVQVDLPVDRFFSAELPAEATAFVRGELAWN